MSKATNYCIIESEFLMSDEDLLSLSRSERYVFVCAWNYAVFRRTSAFVRSEFESNLARLYDLRRRTVAETLQKCGENARLVKLDGDMITIVGVEDKHGVLKGWSSRESTKSSTRKSSNPAPAERNVTERNVADGGDGLAKTPIPTEEIIAEWNRLSEATGLRSIAAWNADRQKSLKARWKDEWFRESWKVIFAAAHESQWCKDNRPGIEHVLVLKNALRYYEGSVNGKPRTQRAPDREYLRG